jgi:hypothetical protein
LITPDRAPEEPSLLIPNTNKTHGVTIATLQNKGMTNEKNKASKAKSQNEKKKKEKSKIMG